MTESCDKKADYNAQLNKPEHFLLSKFSEALTLFSNKSGEDANESFQITKDLLIQKKFNEWIMPNIIHMLIPLMEVSRKPKEKEYALVLLDIIAENYPKQVCSCLIDLVPVVSNLFWDTKVVVQNTAKPVLENIIKCSGNKDLDPFLPVVLSTFEDPSSTPEAVEKLAGCVFVQNVECAAITIIEPILNRGLKDKTNEVKRKACVIIDNMCKLVEHPKEVLPLVSKIQPLVESCAENISDPEARSIAQKALNTLKNSYGETTTIVKKEYSELYEMTKFEIKKYCISPMGSSAKEEIEYLSKIYTNMCNAYYFEYDIWLKYTDSFLQTDDNSLVLNVCKNIFNKTKSTFVQKEEIFEDTEEGVDLYKGVFSLAYGALTLLNNVNVHLKRNRFYGLLGPNNCGKTTLMRAIANEQIEGFPKRDQLRTIFVEHEIQERVVGEDSVGYDILNTDLNGIEWTLDCCNFVYKMEPQVERSDVERVMEELGFGNSEKGTGKDRAADATMQVTTYSGGWKMKMQLCAATLMNADILMLDEPTGHLDVTNIAWIKAWLQTFIDKGGSVITTSHEPVFLNEMCTHLIDFQNRKLKMFKGTFGTVLKEFVEKYPEKQGYFELKNDVIKFVFPEPGPLDGVKSMSKSIMKMNGVAYQYPIRDTPTIVDIGLEVSRVSRVAVIGPNGAGKTTAIKVLNGELKPTAGTIVKHPNLRLAYVAQHAFHHLEKHITKTPTQYILWRFAGNEDRENLTKTESTESEFKICKYFVNPSNLTELKICASPEEDKKAVEPEFINARRDNKKLKTRDYQVKWKGKTMENMLWVTREILIKMGSVILVQRCDEKEAAAAGLMTKTLTAANIEKHLQDFSIDAEQASHTQLGALSGGQKVKVVIAASLWQNPHLIILDEPTNYLDRDGLGALTKAIEEYKGGVIIISHNREFANAVAQEKWIMEAGRLRREGASIEKEEEKPKGGNKEMDAGIVKDAYGNEIKVERQVTLNTSEKKTKAKKLAKQLKEGKKNNTLTDDEIYELEDQIIALKE